jgi:hypothetical protein
MAPLDVGPVHSLAWDSKHSYLVAGGNAVMLLYKVGTHTQYTHHHVP